MHSTRLAEQPTLLRFERNGTDPLFMRADHLQRPLTLRAQPTPLLAAYRWLDRWRRLDVFRFVHFVIQLDDALGYAFFDAFAGMIRCAIAKRQADCDEDDLRRHNYQPFWYRKYRQYVLIGMNMSVINHREAVI